MNFLSEEAISQLMQEVGAEVNHTGDLYVGTDLISTRFLVTKKA
jgi:hypothetical protein